MRFRLYHRSEMAREGELQVSSKVYSNATVLIVDVAGFIKVNEVVGPPRLLLNPSGLIRSTVLRHGGDVVQSAGDSFVCVFDGDCDAAIEAGVGVVSELKAAPNALKARIGIATGQLIITSIGDAARPLRSITGVPFHLASRLQAEAAKLEPPILICPETARASQRFEGRPTTIYRSDGDCIKAFVPISRSQ